MLRGRELAPRKPTNFEAALTTAMDDLATKFSSFETMMTQALDKPTGLEAWRTAAEGATDKLLAQTERLESRLHRLEVAPPPPSSSSFRPSTAPPQPPSKWTNPLDLNLAPPPVTRPPASSGERPHGHHDDLHYRDAGGGILGSHPPHPVTGMPLILHPIVLFCMMDLGRERDALFRFRRSSFLNLMGRTLDCGVTIVKCISRCILWAII